MVLHGVEPGGESYQQLQQVVFGAGDSGNGLSLEGLGTQLQQMHSCLVQVRLFFHLDCLLIYAGCEWTGSYFSSQRLPSPPTCRRHLPT